MPSVSAPHERVAKGEIAAKSSTARARWAVSTAFFINGVVLASWVPHIPAVKAAHALSDGALGAVLLCMALGAVLALPLAGWLTSRVGSHRSTACAALGLCVALPLPVVSPSVALLSLSLVLLGACNGMLDVSMNAQAVAIEARYRRPIMSSFHGFFGLGGFAGAALAGGAMSLGIDGARHVVTMAVLCGLAVAHAQRWFPSSPAEPQGPGFAFATPSRALLGLGILAFCALLAEGAMADWSAVYMRDALGTSAAEAATGFAAFSLTMAGGRFAGDLLAARLGRTKLLRVSSVIAAGGLGAALLIGQPSAAVIGFGLVGAGISNAVPVLFGAAGGTPGVAPGMALAAVATTGYLGFLAGPPLIGLAAEMAGLPAALGIVSVLCAFSALYVGRIVAGRADPGRSLQNRIDVPRPLEDRRFP
jgi:fucose permease